MLTLYPKNLYVTNKNQFVVDCCCPKCGTRTVKEEVKVENDVSFVFTEMDYCSKCARFYVSREQLCVQNEQIQQKFPKAPRPFVVPVNALLVFDGDDVLVVPHALIDKNRYNRWNLPLRRDDYYVPSLKEYQWIIQFFQPQNPYKGKAKKESVLRIEGYSHSLPYEVRRKIIDKCISEYGKEKVLKTLHFLVTTRVNQKDGKTRFKEHIGPWSDDIEYIWDNYD